MLARMRELLLLAAAGLLGGAMNALAGGGSFVTLPALIAAGLPSVAANASSTVALYPGGAASAFIYRETPGPVCGVGVVPLFLVTVAGSLAGSLLLLWTPSSAFDLALPWLLLFATLALAFSRRVGMALRGRIRGSAAPVLLLQALLGVYGGYFGGAVGLMMVATWSLLGETDIKALNAPRTLMVTAANSVAVVTFIIAGVIVWPQTLAMLLGGLVGGTVGSRIGRRLPAPVTRVMTLCVTIAITAAFFVRAYL